MNDGGRLPAEPLCVTVLFTDELGDVLLGVGDGLLDARAVPLGFPNTPLIAPLHVTVVPPFDVVVVHDADALPP